MTTIISTADLGKALSVRYEKKDDEEVVNARVALSGMFVNREQMDFLLQRPDGWSNFLFDELGAPVARLGLLLLAREWTGTIALNGTKPFERATIREVTIRNASLTLTNIGASLDATVCFNADQNPVELLNTLLGRTVRASLVIDDNVQLDLLRAPAAASAPKHAA